MNSRSLLRVQLVRTDLEETFEFFADARNLERITPPWLHFRILAHEPVEMGEGTRISYRLRLHGVPVRWQSVIADWSPPHTFTDMQLRGPFTYWRHEHRIQPVAAGTLVRDHVTYEVPGGRLFGPLVDRIYVRRALSDIFDYRQQALAEALGGPSFPVSRQRDRRND